MDRRQSPGIRLTIVVLLLPALLVACANGPQIKRGADVDAAGPHYSGAAPGAGPQESAAGPPSEPPVFPSISSSAAPLDALRARIVSALATENAIAGASLTIEQRQSAGGQLVFKWTASDNPGDEAAKAGLRTQALAILQQTHLSGLSYGSVLLIASAMVYDAGGHKTEVIAVRAKYSRSLVVRTDFTAVPEASVFQLPDDKPAELDPHFA